MQNAARIRAIELDGFSESVHTISQIGPNLHATRDADISDSQYCHCPGPCRYVCRCEHAYEQATGEGYTENPAVPAALTGLKSAWMALQIANCNLMTAK